MWWPVLECRVLYANNTVCQEKKSQSLVQKAWMVPLASSWNVTGFSFSSWSWFSSGRKFSCSATVASSVPLLWLSSCPCLGKDLGRNQNGMPDNRITVPVTMKPSHQAPTQRESLWLMVMLSGRWRRAKQQIIKGRLFGDLATRLHTAN